MEQPDVWYFAYGSNLNRRQVQERLGRVPEARRALLAGWRLCFNKQGRPTYANIVRSQGGEVWGVLYRCTATDLERMDRFEGVPAAHYRRIAVQVETCEGECLTAVSYDACPERVTREQLPDRAYAMRILEGARESGLPEAYIEGIRKMCGIAG